MVVIEGESEQVTKLVAREQPVARRESVHTCTTTVTSAGLEHVVRHLSLKNLVGTVVAIVCVRMFVQPCVHSLEATVVGG